MPPYGKYPEVDGVKRCSKCGVAEPVADFYEVRKGTAKLFAACKPCTISQQSARPTVGAYRLRWQQTHREQVRAANNAQYSKDPQKAVDRDRQRWLSDPNYRMRKTARTINVRRGRAYAALVDVVTIAEIGERDAWTGQLCGEPTGRQLLEQPALSRKHPGYPTIHHIQPFSVATDGCTEAR